MQGTVVRVLWLIATFFAVAIGAAGSAQAGLVTIDFENDATGFYFNGYQSPSSADVVFSSTESRSTDPHDYISIDHFGQGSHGKGLAISSGNPGLGAGLIMDFLKPTDFLSLEFGNDDPDQSFTGLKQVVLTLFSGGLQVGESIIAPNKNGIMDQNIAYSGQFFDRARFFFIDDFDFPALVNPIVDNVAYQNHTGPGGINNVPAPGGLLLFSIGLLVAYARRKRLALL